MQSIDIDTQTSLAHSVCQGKEDGFARLYDDYSGLLFGIILRIVGDSEDAENLLQDCFIKVWQNMDQYDPSKGKLATWLINIARNTAIDFTRSKYFNQRLKNQNIENLVGQDREAVVSAAYEDTLGLRQLVEKLSAGCRQIIEWMYFDGYTQQEISDSFDIPLGTVKSRTRSALKELRKYYEIPKLTQD